MHLMTSFQDGFVDASFILWVFPEGGNDQGIAYYNEK